MLCRTNQALGGPGWHTMAQCEACRQLFRRRAELLVQARRPAPEERRGVSSDPKGPPASWRTHWERVPRPTPAGARAATRSTRSPSRRSCRPRGSLADARAPQPAPRLACHRHDRRPGTQGGNPDRLRFGRRGLAWKDFAAALVPSFHGAFSRARLMRLVRCSLVCGSRGNRYQSPQHPFSPLLLGDLRSVRVENCRTDSPLGQ